MENQDYKNEIAERKFFENIQINQFLRVKSSLLELEKDFMEFKDIESKDRRERTLKR